MGYMRYGHPYDWRVGRGDARSSATRRVRTELTGSAQMGTPFLARANQPHAEQPIQLWVDCVASVALRRMAAECKDRNMAHTPTVVPSVSP